MATDVRQALSELLDALGFERMAQDVLTETRTAYLSRYAKLILNNTKDAATRRKIRESFYTLRLI